MANILFDGISQDNGLQFLTSIRYETSQPGPTYITALDDLLVSKSPTAEIDSPVRRGESIEIQGPSRSGKSSILYFLTMTTVLPPFWDDVVLGSKSSSRPPRKEKVALGGRGKSVAVFDCDGRWSGLRLYRFIKSHLKRRVKEHCNTVPALYSAEAQEEEYESMARSCLSRVHVFRPLSSISLAASLRDLPRYHREECKDEEFLFVMVDSISAFHWQDQYQYDELPKTTSTKSNQGGSSSSSKVRLPHTSPSSQNPMIHTLSALNDLRRTIAPVFVLTNWALAPMPMPMPSRNPKDSNSAATATSSSSSRVTGTPFFKQHLPAPYPHPFPPPSSQPIPSLATKLKDASNPLSTSSFTINHHITLHAPDVPSFPPGTTASQALSDKERKGDVEEPISVGVLRIAGVDGGKEVGRFAVGVRDWGLET